MDKTQLGLNIALGAGLAPLFLGYVAALIPDIRSKMIDARQVIAPFVAFCVLIFSVTTLVLFHNTLDLILNMVMTGGIVLLWMWRLGYWKSNVWDFNPNTLKRSRKLPSRKSIFDEVFGYGNTTARIVVFAGFILVGIPVMILINTPVWVVASSPAFFLGLFWALEDIKILK